MLFFYTLRCVCYGCNPIDILHENWKCLLNICSLIHLWSNLSTREPWEPTNFSTVWKCKILVITCFRVCRTVQYQYKKRDIIKTNTSLNAIVFPFGFSIRFHLSISKKLRFAVSVMHVIILLTCTNPTPTISALSSHTITMLTDHFLFFSFLKQWSTWGLTSADIAVDGKCLILWSLLHWGVLIAASSASQAAACKGCSTFFESEDLPLDVHLLLGYLLWDSCPCEDVETESGMCEQPPVYQSVFWL
jgi:hypothetical protein